MARTKKTKPALVAAPAPETPKGLTAFETALAEVYFSKRGRSPADVIETALDDLAVLVTTLEEAPAEFATAEVIRQMTEIQEVISLATQELAKTAATTRERAA